MFGKANKVLTSPITGASLFMLASVFTPAAAQEEMDSSLPGKLAEVLHFQDKDAALDMILGSADYVILGDPNHVKHAFHDFLTGAELKDAMKRNGRTCLALEVYDFLDEGSLEQLKIGQITSADLARKFMDKGVGTLREDVEDMLSYWTDYFTSIKDYQDRDIEVHFSDPENKAEMQAYEEWQAHKFFSEAAPKALVKKHIKEELGIDLSEGWPEDAGQRAAIIVEARLYQQTEEFQEKIKGFIRERNKAYDKWLRLRFDDTGRANRILDLSGACIIAAGAGHGDGAVYDLDLDEFLGEDRSVRVSVYSTLQDYIDDFNKQNGWSGMGPDHPELVLTLDNYALYPSVDYRQVLDEKGVDLEIRPPLP